MQLRGQLQQRLRRRRRTLRAPLLQAVLTRAPLKLQMVPALEEAPLPRHLLNRHSQNRQRQRPQLSRQ